MPLSGKRSSLVPARKLPGGSPCMGRTKRGRRRICPPTEPRGDLLLRQIVEPGPAHDESHGSFASNINGLATTAMAGVKRDSLESGHENRWPVVFSDKRSKGQFLNVPLVTKSWQRVALRRSSPRPMAQMPVTACRFQGARPRTSCCASTADRIPTRHPPRPRSGSSRVCCARRRRGCRPCRSPGR